MLANPKKPLHFLKASKKMTKKKESFIFYRSFYEAIKELPESQQITIFKSICELALDEKEQDLNGVEKIVFTLIKPQILANNKRYSNGLKGAEFGQLGGRPKNPKETPNITPKKPQENPKETPNVNDNDNDNINDNVNVNVNDNKNYAFNGEIIKLNQKDFDNWKNKFKYIQDLTFELEQLDLYLLRNPEKAKKWFFYIQQLLLKKNKELEPLPYNPRL